MALGGLCRVALGFAADHLLAHPALVAAPEDAVRGAATRFSVTDGTIAIHLIGFVVVCERIHLSILAVTGGQPLRFARVLVVDLHAV